MAEKTLKPNSFAVIETGGKQYQVRPGDTILIRPQSRAKGFMRDFELALKKYIPPEWLKLDKEQISGLMVGIPNLDPQESLKSHISQVVEFYSR